MFDGYLLRKLDRLERSRDTAGLEKMLRHSRSWVVSQAASALIRVEGPDAATTLIAALDGADLQARVQLAHLLGQTKHPAAVPPLVTLLRARQTTDAAAEALGRIGDAAAVTALVETLIDRGSTDPVRNALETGLRVLRGGEDDQERYESIAARVEAEMADARQPQAKSVVGAVPADRRGVSTTEVERIRGLALAGAYAAAIAALQDLGAGALSVRDQSGRPWNARHAVKTLADHVAATLYTLEARAKYDTTGYDVKFEEDSFKAAFGKLAEQLRMLPDNAVADPAPDSPPPAATDPLIVELMHRLLREGDEDSRALAVESLRLVGGPAAVTVLREGLADGSAQVRRATLLALHRLGAVNSVDVLRGALTDDWWSIRLAAVAPLAELASPEAVEALRALTADESPDVRRAATNVLSGT